MTSQQFCRPTRLLSCTSNATRFFLRCHNYIKRTTMFLDHTHCLVCRTQPNDYSSVVNVNEVIGPSQGRTVKACIERVLDTKFASSISTFICSKCYTDLMQIEAYYCLVEEFRNRYKKGLEKQAQALSLQATYNDHVPQANPLFMPPVDSSILLEPNQPTFDLLGVGYPSTSQAYLGSCRYENKGHDIPEYNRENKHMKRVLGPSDGMELNSQHIPRVGPNEKIPRATTIHDTSLVEKPVQNEDKHEVQASISASCREPPTHYDDPPDQVKEESPDSDTDDKGTTDDVLDDDDDDYEEEEEKSEREKNKGDLHANTGGLACIICSKSYLTEGRLRRHMISHTSSCPHKCKLCGMGFDDEHSLALHAKTHSSSKSRRRESSGEQEVAMKEDEDDEDNDEDDGESGESSVKKIRHKCTLCGKGFNRIREFRLHKVHVHGKNGFLICPECGEEFSDNDQLRSHLKFHYNDMGDWKCNKCGACFRGESRLRTHLNGNKCKNKLHACTACDKVFISPAGLTNHIRTHTGEMPYECSFCKKRFNNSSNHKAHLRIHTGETPYKCSLCPMAFTQSGARNAHEKTHAEEPAFSCDICGKGFYWPTAYKKHLRSHSSVKTQLCTLCGKAFRDTASLTCHLKTHSDVRPHKCSFCEKGFKTSKHRKVHERIHTGEKPYICHICGRGFTQATGLKFHMKTHRD